MIKKVTISPKNSKAIAFFEDLHKKKEEIKKKLEKSSAFSKVVETKKNQIAR